MQAAATEMFPDAAAAAAASDVIDYSGL